LAWDRIIEDWKRIKKKIGGTRAASTEVDLITTNRLRHQLEGKIQEPHYGDTKHQVRFHWDEWLP
jgi:hypothetical protein